MKHRRIYLLTSTLICVTIGPLAEGRAAAARDRALRPAVATSPERALPTALSTPGDLEAAFADAEPLSLAAGDFDGDGMPDLAAAYATRAGSLGIVALWRGNVDAVYGWTDEARRRRAAGTFADAPFLGPPALFAVPEPPDFLAAGDFDGDSNWDLAGGARNGEAIYLLSGDGKGGLGAAETIAIPGRIGAWASGEVNRRDGLADIVVAVDGEAGPRLVVFEGPNGALRWQPEVIPLDGPADDLALGLLDGDLFADIAVAGTPGIGTPGIAFVQGRDRRLSVGGGSGRQVPPARVTIAEEGLDESVEATAAEAFARQNPFDSGSRAIGRATGDGIVAGLAMRLDADAFPDLVLLEAGKPQPSVVVNGIGIIWTVNSNADTSDGSCDALGTGTGNQDCTLREALLLAQSGDSIRFSIPGDVIFPPTIAVTSQLTVASGLTIDGTTQAQGAVALSGSSAGAGVNGLRITGTSNVVRGLRIGNFTQNGILVSGVGNTVEQCWIGLSGLGAAASNGNAGIEISAGDNTVGCTGVTPCNVIGSNLGPGVRIIGASPPEHVNTALEGNYIGTNTTGTSALGNMRGVEVFKTSQTRIGGPTSGARNVISGNTGAGIRFVDTELALVLGNYIGTDASGTSALGNGDGGVALLDLSTETTVGGTISAARNVISGNTGAGIRIGTGGGLTDNNLIQGNYIGTNKDGNGAVANSEVGILHTEAASTDNAIGGTVPGAGNLVSGNAGHGILFESKGPIQGMSVLRNRIGTDVAATGDLGNGEAGVAFEWDPTGDLSSTVTVGNGTVAGGNQIAFNACGVLVSSGKRWSLRGNQIASNDHLGISLLDSGLGASCASDRVTFNDLLDVDFGANSLKNFPIITQVSTNSGTTTIEGSYRGEGNITSNLDFYASQVCDPSGFGEGEEYLGSAAVVANSAGTTTFSFEPSAPVVAGRWVTATATSVSGDTSEFSACRREDASCGAPPHLILDGGSINDLQTYEACQTITAGGDEADPLTVEGVGDLTLLAGESVEILNGFVVEGALEIAIDPALAP